MRRLFHIYLELSKSRLSALVALTTVAGYLLAGRTGSFDWWGFLWTVVGTALASGGANGINQWWEADPDSLMERTRERPVPSSRIGLLHALIWSVATSAMGIVILAWLVNPLTAILGALTVLLYTLIYTPLKRRTSLCTLVGAVCGAIPPMMGWTGAAGELGSGAWILAAILFIWQIPHFLALAWMYRADYERGGFRMLPVIDRSGRLTGTAVVLYCFALLPVAVSLSLVGVTGWFYAAGSLVLGGMMLSLGVTLNRKRTDLNARRLFLASLAYLSLLMGLMAADRAVPPLSSPAVANVVEGR